MANFLVLGAQLPLMLTLDRLQLYLILGVQEHLRLLFLLKLVRERLDPYAHLKHLICLLLDLNRTLLSLHFRQLEHLAVLDLV